MLGAIVTLTAAAAGWIAQPWLIGLVRARTGPDAGAPAPRRIARWTSRPMIAAGSAIVGTAGFTALPPLLLAVCVSAGLLGWWLACIDLAIHRLPDPLVGALVGVFALGYALVYLTGEAELASLVRAVIAGVLAAGGFGVLALSRPRAMGFGDVKLAGALGLGTGFFGWEVAGQWVFLSFIAGGIFAVLMLLTRRLTSRDNIAFGPWLLLGAGVAIALNALPGVTH